MGTFFINAWHSNAQVTDTERVLLIGDMRVHRLRPYLEEWTGVPVDSVAGNISCDVCSFIDFVNIWLDTYSYSCLIIEERSLSPELKSKLDSFGRTVCKISRSKNLKYIQISDCLQEKKYSQGGHSLKISLSGLLRCFILFLIWIYWGTVVYGAKFPVRTALLVFSTLRSRKRIRSLIYDFYAADLSKNFRKRKGTVGAKADNKREHTEWACIAINPNAEAIYIGDCHMRYIYNEQHKISADLFSTSLNVADNLYKKIAGFFTYTKYKKIIYSVGVHVKLVDLDNILQSVDEFITYITSSHHLTLCTSPYVMPIGISKELAISWNDRIHRVNEHLMNASYVSLSSCNIVKLHELQFSRIDFVHFDKASYKLISDIIKESDV